MSADNHAWIPDESGMGGDWLPLDRPHYDPDSGRWMVQIDSFRARPTTDAEAAAIRQGAQS
jgi:hypothetical protein